MKYFCFPFLFAALLFMSCADESENNPWVAANTGETAYDSLTIDSLKPFLESFVFSYNTFAGQFEELTLPHTIQTRGLVLSHYDPNYFGEINTIQPVKDCLNKQMLDFLTLNCEVAEPTNFAGNYPSYKSSYTNDCENGGWYRIEPFFRFKASNGTEYFILGEYEQISATNGGGWSLYLFHLNDEAGIEYIREIGQELCFRHSDSYEKETYVWEESWSYTTSSIFISADSIHSTYNERYVSHYTESGENIDIDTLKWEPDEVEVVSVKF